MATQCRLFAEQQEQAAELAMLIVGTPKQCSSSLLELCINKARSVVVMRGPDSYIESKVGRSDNVVVVV